MNATEAVRASEYRRKDTWVLEFVDKASFDAFMQAHIDNSLIHGACVWGIARGDVLERNDEARCDFECDECIEQIERETK